MAEDDSLATIASQAPITSLTDHPNGTLDHDHNGRSVLQQLVAFFDQDNNGVACPWETFAATFCLLLLMHLLNWVTLAWFQCICFSLYGALVQCRGELSYSASKSCVSFGCISITFKQIESINWFAKDEDGYLSKEAAQGCNNGSLFEYIAKNKKGEGKMS